MNQKLLDCPFCGWHDIDYQNYGSDGHLVVCKGCGTSTSFFESGEAATAAWNRRVIDTSAQTFYVIKRDEEPRYWDSGSGWSKSAMSLMTDEGAKASLEWLRENSLEDSVKTARIVKVRVEEVNDENAT